MQNILDTLFSLLPLLARVTGGYATVTTRDGFRIKTYNSEGLEVEELKDHLFELARNAGQTMEVQTGPSAIVDGAEVWALPIGEYVLAASNVERFLRDKELMNSLQEALPFIARVAGGEGVIFDNKGTRLESVDPYGNRNNKFIGTVSEAAWRSMQDQKPVIGQSTTVNGAVAVRIPITKEFGFGFNNELSVKREQKLLEEVKKYQYARYNFEDIIGESETIKKVKSMAAFVAQGISSIIIYGETGTGKELFAQAIHNSSPRRSKPFVAINCAAIPATIIESILFGYEEGAFTGAKKNGSPGSFEQANEGTILLDEISEMDLNLQTKLLRILQEREVIRIGGSKPVKIDVRVIASTNKDLNQLIKDGRFREDLYYRLNVVQLKIPPLRERLEDTPVIIKYFINKYNKLLGKYILKITDSAQTQLISYNWPGNVRELQNCIEHAMNMVSINEDTIAPEHLPPYIKDNSKTQTANHENVPLLSQVINNAEREAIQKALRVTRGKKKEAAELLGISTITLWRKMNQYSLQ